MPIPPMKPSAYERREHARKEALKQWDDEQHDKPWPMPADAYLVTHELDAIEQAYRDGIAVDRDAAIAALREPSDEVVDAATIAALGVFCKPQINVEWYELQPLAKSKWRAIARAALAAAASLLEKELNK